MCKTIKRCLIFSLVMVYSPLAMANDPLPLALQAAETLLSTCDEADQEEALQHVHRCIGSAVESVIDAQPEHRKKILIDAFQDVQTYEDTYALIHALRPENLKTLDYQEFVGRLGDLCTDDIQKKKLVLGFASLLHKCKYEHFKIKFFLIFLSFKNNNLPLKFKKVYYHL